MGGERTVDEVIAELAADPGLADALGPAGVAGMTELLEWKAVRDRRLERWRRKDVDAFLLDHAPQQLDSSPEAVAALPGAFARYLDWLEERGRLRGDPPAVLRDRIADLVPAYTARAADPARWSEAKTLWMALTRAGVDPDDPEAVGAWLAARDAGEAG